MDRLRELLVAPQPVAVAPDVDEVELWQGDLMVRHFGSYRASKESTRTIGLSVFVATAFAGVTIA